MTSLHPSASPTPSLSRPKSARPQTAFTTTTAELDYFDRDLQYTYSQDHVEDDDDDDESDAEGVFAFARPPTGDTNQPISSSAPIPIASPTIAYPPRALDSNFTTNPYIPNNSIPGPSTLHARHPYPASPVVESPPSTDSQSDGDPYRLRRLPPQTATTTSEYPSIDNIHRSAVSSAISSREVHVALPSTIDEERAEDSIAKDSMPVKAKLRPPSSDASFPTLGSRDSIKMEFDFDAVDNEEDSPFPEVRAAVSNVDDTEMPALTVRVWIVGLFLSLTTAAANVFFNFRQPAPTIYPSVLLLLAHPMGKFLALALPITPYRIPRLFDRIGPFNIDLNPGPWNIKEHALVYMMTNVSVNFPYALFAVVVAEFNYGAKLGFGFSVTLILATQMTGFGLAGLSRRFLVWPASMLWPQNLVVCTLLNTFHAEEDRDQGGLSRYRYFLYLSLAAFFFFFLPGYLFTALSIFNWVCWITPNNIVINQLFGSFNGLGMSVLTFDWTEINWTNSPLIMPWWAQLHTFFGFVCFYWILAPALYYTNTWQLAHFPILANAPYDRFGNPYNVSLVLRADDTLDPEAFANYSPLYLPASYAITYLIAFALSSCIIVHTALYYGPSMIKGLKRQQIEQDDVHAKLMRAYPEVPDWWYLVVFLVFFSLMIVSNEIWHTELPVWGLLLAILIVLIFVIPSGYIYAMTAQTLSTNLLAQVIPGTLLTGKPIANMVFKAYVIQSLSEATSFVQDLKLGHYIKIPPRASFIVQLVGCTLAGFVQVGVKQAMFDFIPDICQPTQRSFLTCPHNQVYYTASAVWGLIGPSRQFGPHSIYHPELYALVIGVFLPFPFWYWQRRYPNGWNGWISTPVVLNSVTYIPPATGINYSSWFLVGFIFQYWIRTRHFAWWSKFNYVTTAAMDSGTLVCILFIFFVLQVPKGGLNVNWWGNTVWMNTLDYQHKAFLPTPPEGLPLSS